MEQDRAPDVLPHHGELARSAVGEPRGGGQPDWPHDDEDGVGDSVRTGREQLSNRSRSHGAATGEPRYQAGQVPRRMELYHPAKDINGQFILASCLRECCMMESPTTKSLQDIEVTTLKTWMEQEEAILIDVREPLEYATEHIPGARLLPLSTF